MPLIEIETPLLDILAAIQAAGNRAKERWRSSGSTEPAAQELLFLRECLAQPRTEARVFAVQHLAHAWASTSATAESLVSVASSDSDKWVRYAAMASLIEHRVFPCASEARAAARSSSDKLMKLAERGGTGTYAPDLEKQFRQSLAASPERPPLEIAVELARNVWPSILLDWSSVSCDDQVRADQREIESALLAKKDLLRFSAEALFIAEAHLDRPSEPDEKLIEKYGKPLSHLVLVNHRDFNSFHDEDPFASVPIPSLEYFGSAYGLGGNGSSFKRYVGLANLFWPILKKHSAFVAGTRGKRPILVGVFHPEDPVPVLGNIEFPGRSKS